LPQLNELLFDGFGVFVPQLLINVNSFMEVHALNGKQFESWLFPIGLGVDQLVA
jgi:hypothetical protein